MRASGFFDFVITFNSGSSILLFSFISSIWALARSFALYFRFLGFVRRRYPQHGHHKPSHLMNISQIWHRFCPLAYLPIATGFWDLWRMQIPLQVNFCSTSVQREINAYLRPCSKWIFEVGTSGCFLDLMDGLIFFSKSKSRKGMLQKRCLRPFQQVFHTWRQ